MSEETNDILSRATQAIQESNFGEALALADSMLAVEQSADAFIVRGIALAQMQRPEEATSAFRSAIATTPGSARAYYNLATHQYQQGQHAEARAMAGEASRLEPTHVGARDLIALVDAETARAENAEPPAGGMPYGSASAPNLGSPQQRFEPVYFGQGAVPFVERLGKTWDAIGWLLAAASATTWFLIISEALPYVNRMIENPNNRRAIEAELERNANPIISLLIWGTIVSVFVWALLDLTNRRGNWAWLALFIPCSCVGCLVVPLYLLTSRK